MKIRQTILFLLIVILTLLLAACSTTESNSAQPPIKVKINSAFVIDSNTIDLTDTKIPLEYLDKARKLNVLFNHQSVGFNILDGLKRLSKYNPTRYSVNIVDNPSVIWFNTSGGIGGFTYGTNGYPSTKVEGFKNLLEVQGYGNRISVSMMKMCFVDSVMPASQIFNSYRDGMLYLENKYPNVKFVWWTMPITRDGDRIRDEYNRLVRDYTRANNKILFDIVDIESTDLTGKSVKDNGFEILNQDYSLPDRAHLNNAGADRVARAWWWMMARLAGWNGN